MILELAVAMGRFRFQLASNPDLTGELIQHIPPVLLKTPPARTHSTIVKIFPLRYHVHGKTICEESQVSLMKLSHLVAVANHLKQFAQERGVSALIVGSVAYSGALSSFSAAAACDDLDAILVYDRLTQLEECPFIGSSRLYAQACREGAGASRLFSSKLLSGGIKMSIDFVSDEYLHGVAEEPFDFRNTFRMKLTDAQEKPDNEYASFCGARYIYRKTCEYHGGLYLYKLPIHISSDNEYYTGALYNKFVHNPYPLVERKNIEDTRRLLLYNYSRHFHRIKQERPDANIFNAMLFRGRFSEESENFVRNIPNLYLQDKR